MGWFKSGCGLAEPELLLKLDRIFSSGSGSAAFTFERLRALAGAPPQADLAFALQALIAKGKVRSFVRVESPGSKGGIKDFESLDQVPDEILDWRTGRMLEIGKENVRVLFSPKSQT